MVQSGLRRTVWVWFHFTVGVKGAIVDWELKCVLSVARISERRIALRAMAHSCRDKAAP